MSGMPVPDPILERFRLGELPARSMEDLRARCAANAGLRARLEALERSDRSILEAHPPAAMSRAILERRRNGEASPGPSRPRGAAPGRTRRPGLRALRSFWAAPAGLALACGLLLAVRFAPRWGNGEVTERPEAYAVRLKGSEAGLAIFRKAREAAELLPPQSLAKPGDTLQVFYHSRGPAYGVIFSVDGAGGVTLHLPEDGSGAASLQAGDLLPLPHAYRLDRAPGPERFFLVTAAGPFAIDGLLDRARAAFAAHRQVPDSLPGLEAGFRQYPYTLRKPGAGGKAQ